MRSFYFFGTTKALILVYFAVSNPRVEGFSLTTVSPNKFPAPFSSKWRCRPLRADSPNIRLESPRASSKRIKLYSSNMLDNEEPISSKSITKIRKLELWMSRFTFLAPLWTTMVALWAISSANSSSSSFVATTVGSLPVMQTALALLMFAMGLTIGPKDISSALRNPSVVISNALLCYGMMPALAMGISKVMSYSPNQTIGMVLLGSVGGGQASNLFTLIAGGDVALSVICTLSTTILGVFATPLLAKFLLGYSVDVNGLAVLKSVATMVLLPLTSGLTLGQISPKRTLNRAKPFLPFFGVLATLVLVAGGASNTIGTTTTHAAAAASASSAMGSEWSFSSMKLLFTDTILPSCLLSCLGGFVAWIMAKCFRMKEESKKTLVIETLSKSPTLAYVLCRKHFGLSTAAIPAAAMVTLAVLGALIASLWSLRMSQ